MGMKRTLFLIAMGVLIMLFGSGCGKQKYKLNFDGYGFESKKTEYAAGEKVTASSTPARPIYKRERGVMASTPGLGPGGSVRIARFR